MLYLKSLVRSCKGIKYRQHGKTFTQHIEKLSPVTDNKKAETQVSALAVKFKIMKLALVIIY